MNEREIQRTLRRNSAVLTLERVFPRRVRGNARRIVTIMIVIFGLFTAMLFFLGNSDFINESDVPSILNNLALEITRFVGALFILTVLWLILVTLDFFYYSNYFDGFKSTISRIELYKRRDGLSFALLKLLDGHRNEKDLAQIAFRSAQAHELVNRLGIPFRELRNFLKENDLGIPKEFPLRENGKMILIRDIIALSYHKSPAIQDFFFKRGVNSDIFYGALEWTEVMRRERLRNLTWWSRINLGEISGIAKDWAYGGAYTLRRYATEIRARRTHAGTSVLHARDEIETILSKSREANALLVGARGGGRDQVISDFAARVYEGKSPAPLEGKHIFRLDSVALSTNNPDKHSFESELLKLLNDSVRAGNIILVIDNISDFLLNARSIGVDVREIFDPFLASDSLQLVATATPEEVETSLRDFPFTRTRFEKIRVKIDDNKELISLLSYAALNIEARSDVFFTFQSLAKTADLARSALVDSTLPDDAVDILYEAAAGAKTSNSPIITETEIETLISNRTGIPVGKASASEREELLKLEENLSSMVVGQTDALKAVSNALRRNRAGIGEDDRPMGSFLFLGPTGVGKTQVARSLEATLFDENGVMHRLDMSEFQNENALDRLIGSIDSKSPGILEEKINRSPYGILLLDEFEKAHGNVHNLFLQILDEGFFANSHGKRVNMSNLIIIATSNAGNQEIQAAAKSSTDLSAFKDELISTLINDQIFRPELLNRFDEVVLFEPLSKDDLRAIAKLELEKLAERTESTRVRINITDELVEFLAEKGYDPRFGAREMKRVIQDSIERVLSEKILKGEALPGSTVSLSREELEKAL
ncbi:MAG: AAA family ATPase [Candidatus Campbellbacteria bacterium]|nr:AAA family ATPase [Candidatus Campbellbacteria bacterium]